MADDRTAAAVARDALLGHKSTRVGRLRASHSYGYVLAFVLATFVFAAVAPDGGWATSLLVIILSATLVCALWTSGLTRFGPRWSFALVTLAVVAAVANVAVGGPTSYGAVMLFAGVLTVAIVVAIAVGIIDQGEVNRNSVSGAVGIYLLLGLLFVFAYGAAASFGSGPFFAQGTDGTRAVRTYFSFVTLATVGYGDYTPAGTVGHTLSICEALTGQLYLVTIVALLVSRLRVRSSDARRGLREPHDPVS
jgi:hypothetical protein